MKRVLYLSALFALPLMLNGCGAFKRDFAKMTGDAAETCIDGVVYLQFTSGSTVKIDKNTDKPQHC